MRNWHLRYKNIISIKPPEAAEHLKLLGSVSHSSSYALDTYPSDKLIWRIIFQIKWLRFFNIILFSRITIDYNIRKGTRYNRHKDFDLFVRDCSYQSMEYLRKQNILVPGRCSISPCDTHTYCCRYKKKCRYIVIGSCRNLVHKTLRNDVYVL